MNAKIHILATALVAVVVGPAAAQEAAPVTGARKVEDREARQLLKTFKDQLKDKSASMKQRIEACAALGRVQNNMFVKPLMLAAQREKSMAVRQEAIRAIGAQPAKRARPALLTLLDKFDIQDEPGTAAATVRAIGSNCYSPKDWKTFRKMFEKAITDNKAVDAQKAILEVIGQHKEIDALNWLLPHMDPPEPINVDDPANPPASYWKARWENWSKWKGDVLEAVYQITGQRFANSLEARKWLKVNRSNLIREAKAKNSKQKRR